MWVHSLLQKCFLDYIIVGWAMGGGGVGFNKINMHNEQFLLFITKRRRRNGTGVYAVAALEG